MAAPEGDTPSGTLTRVLASTRAYSAKTPWASSPYHFLLTHRFSLAVRQNSQELQIVWGRPVTSSPSFNPSTPSPTLTTLPENS